MAIYNVSGTQIYNAYDVSGNELQTAYDVNGSTIFTAGPITLKVMTYNVGGWYIGSGTNVPSDKDADYYALQKGMIDDADADVIQFQEYWTQFSSTRTALSFLSEKYPYYHVKVYSSGTNKKYFGHAIFSKYPITNYTEHIYSIDSPRYYDSCTVTVTDIPITFVNTHMALTESNRAAQAGELITYLQSLTGNFVLTGDLNTGMDIDSYLSDSDYLNVILPMLNEGWHLANLGEFGWFYTARGDGTQHPLDNIVTNMTITAVELDETKRYDDIDERIDHMPLIATIQI